jgi:hypothetical protein
MPLPRIPDDAFKVVAEHQDTLHAVTMATADTAEKGRTLMAALTAKQRRELEHALPHEAAAKNLRLERRKIDAHRWVWDAIDARTGVAAVRGIGLADMAAYVRGENR